MQTARITRPPGWRARQVLKKLYGHSKIQRQIAQSLREKDFVGLRAIRPLATAAEALDSTLPPREFTFDQAWPALKRTQDREISVTPAVVSRTDAIQVMTIHAAKGLEFPVVLLMKLGKSFPRSDDLEDNRVAYVGATRARDILILVRTSAKLHESRRTTLDFFGTIDKDLTRIRHGRIETTTRTIMPLSPRNLPPLVAATDLDLYEQCPLKFAAYHEGRFLPPWSIPQSMGARMHKALEYYLRANKLTDRSMINDCIIRGLEDGDSPMRPLPPRNIRQIKQAYHNTVEEISETTRKVLAVEKRYRYLQGQSGQIEGAIDALIERKDGAIVLKEWKTSGQIRSEQKRQYELQVRAGALGIDAHNFFPIDLVEIVPVFSPANTISFSATQAFHEKSKEMLDQVFRDLHERNYQPRRGDYCKQCQLKPQCPAW